MIMITAQSKKSMKMMRRVSPGITSGQDMIIIPVIILGIHNQALVCHILMVVCKKMNLFYISGNTYPQYDASSGYLPQQNYGTEDQFL